MFGNVTPYPLLQVADTWEGQGMEVESRELKESRISVGMSSSVYLENYSLSIFFISAFHEIWIIILELLIFIKITIPWCFTNQNTIRTKVKFNIIPWKYIIPYDLLKPYSIYTFFFLPEGKKCKMIYYGRINPDGKPGKNYFLF